MRIIDDFRFFTQLCPEQLRFSGYHREFPVTRNIANILSYLRLMDILSDTTLVPDRKLHVEQPLGIVFPRLGETIRSVLNRKECVSSDGTGEKSFFAFARRFGIDFSRCIQRPSGFREGWGRQAAFRRCRRSARLFLFCRMAPSCWMFRATTASAT